MIEMIRSIIDSVVEGAIKRISGKGRVDETYTDREYFQHYGFTSRPLSGAEAILLRQGNQLIVIASDDRRYRLAIEDGEVALYTDEGDRVYLKRGGIEIHSDNVTVGDTGGSLKALINEELISAFNSHTHPGVQTGGGSTAAPAQQLGNQHKTQNVKAT